MSERETLSAFSEDLKEIYNQLTEFEVKYTPCIEGNVWSTLSKAGKLLLRVRAVADKRIEELNKQ